MRKHNEIDWMKCQDVETIPGKQDGSPLVKGTRIPVQQLVEEHSLGASIEEIASNYELPSDQVQRINTFGSKLQARALNILLDENMPVDLRKALSEFEISRCAPGDGRDLRTVNC